LQDAKDTESGAEVRVASVFGVTSPRSARITVTTTAATARPGPPATWTAMTLPIDEASTTKRFWNRTMKAKKRSSWMYSKVFPAIFQSYGCL